MVKTMSESSFAERGSARALAKGALLGESRCFEAGACACVRAVSKPYLLWPFGLAFERKADAPSYCKGTKIQGSNERFREVSAACKADALPTELHAPRFRFILGQDGARVKARPGGRFAAVVRGKTAGRSARPGGPASRQQQGSRPATEVLPGLLPPCQHVDVLPVVFEQLAQITLLPGSLPFSPGLHGPEPVPRRELSLQPKLPLNGLLAAVKIPFPTCGTQVEVLDLLVQDDAGLGGNDGKIEPDSVVNAIGNRPAVVGDDAVDSLKRGKQRLSRHLRFDELDERVVVARDDSNSGNGNLVVLEVLEQALIVEAAGVVGFDVQVCGCHWRAPALLPPGRLPRSLRPACEAVHSWGGWAACSFHRQGEPPNSAAAQIGFPSREESASIAAFLFCLSGGRGNEDGPAMPDLRKEAALRQHDQPRQQPSPAPLEREPAPRPRGDRRGAQVRLPLHHLPAFRARDQSSLTILFLRPFFGK
jgi:hypothetical protein